jgi:hypothetical protein
MRILLLVFLAVLVSGCDRVISRRPHFPEVSFYIFYDSYKPGTDLRLGAGSSYPNQQTNGRIRNPMVQGGCDARMGSKHAISVDFLGHDRKGNDVYEATVSVTDAAGATQTVKAKGAYGGKPVVIHNGPDLHVFIAPTNPPPGPVIAVP